MSVNVCWWTGNLSKVSPCLRHVTPGIKSSDPHDPELRTKRVSTLERWKINNFSVISGIQEFDGLRLISYSKLDVVQVWVWVLPSGWGETCSLVSGLCCNVSRRNATKDDSGWSLLDGRKVMREMFCKAYMNFLLRFCLAEDVLHTLTGAMSLLRRCRVNAALTIQLFSQLFHFINMWLFNKLVTDTDSGLCCHYWGAILRQQLSHIEAWAEKQGLELAADCHLSRIVQVSVCVCFQLL